MRAGYTQYHQISEVTEAPNGAGRVHPMWGGNEGRDLEIR